MSGDGFDVDPPTEGFQEEGAPAWTTTFGDLMSLLLTFFILLYSMSELKMERFLLASQSLSQAMSGTAAIPDPAPTGPVPSPQPARLLPDGSPPAPGAVPLQNSPDRQVDQEMERIEARLRLFIQDNALEETFSVGRTDAGVELRILSTALFASGSGVIEPGSGWILTYLGEITGSLDVAAVVAGHADNERIQTAQYASNWELSAVRAAGVARELVENGHHPGMIRVESFGEQRPVASNNTAEGRALNRRVEVLFSRDDILASIQRRAFLP